MQPICNETKTKTKCKHQKVGSQKVAQKLVHSKSYFTKQTAMSTAYIELVGRWYTYLNYTTNRSKKLGKNWATDSLAIRQTVSHRVSEI